MAFYYLAWRPHQEIGNYATALIAELKDRFGHVGISRKAVGPHITLIPPFQTEHFEALKEVVKVTIAGMKPLQVRVNGFDCFNRRNKVIFLSIEAPPEMLQLRNALAKELNAKISGLQKPFLQEKTLTWHLTVAYREINDKFAAIWDYLQEKEKPILKESMDSLSIVGEGKITDFLFKEPVEHL